MRGSMHVFGEIYTGCAALRWLDSEGWEGFAGFE